MLNKKEASTIALIVIIIVGIFGALFLLQRPENTAPEIIPSPEPRRVQSYNGEIVSIEDGAFVMLAYASNNPLEQDAKLHISFTKDTRFTRMTIPKASPENAERIKTASEEIAPSDIKIGDRVIVYAEKNIRGKEEFTADAVTIVSIK